MNNKLTISLLAVLGIAGGGYMMKDSLPDLDMNLTQYIPEPITSILGLETSAETNSEVASMDAEQMDVTDTATAAVNDMIEELEVTDNAQAEQDIFMKAPAAAPIEEAAVEEVAPVTQETQVQGDANSTKIESKIQENNSEITRLSLENTDLEKRFQEILKKNRSLAEELKQLDEKIAQSN